MVKRTRTFRVFVSSTFTDMQEERNALQQKVFPRLQELCMGHGMRFQAVDLRWGVSEEACLNQQTVKICLTEILRCQHISPRPNFITLLGDRYGWRPLPPEISVEEFAAIKRFIAKNKSLGQLKLLKTWYKRDNNQCPPAYILQARKDKFIDWRHWKPVEKELISLFRQAVTELSFNDEDRFKYFASVTEQEILRGVLKIEDNKEHVFCFHRQISNLPKTKDTEIFLDLDDSGRWDDEATACLNQLKAKLKNELPGNVFEYSAEWTGKGITYDHLEQFCEDAYKALAKVIEAEILKMETLDPLDLEIQSHRSFGLERAKYFVGREEFIQKLRSEMQNSEQCPIVISGDAGTGKSAFMGHIAIKLQRIYPQANIIQRFIGATPDSVLCSLLLNSICHQIARLYHHKTQKIPQDYEKLSQAFPNLLKLATKEHPLIILIDAIDQFVDIKNGQKLSWIPAQLPDHVWLVISTLPNNYLFNLRKLIPNTKPIVLKPMTSKEGRKLLKIWLEKANRTLTKHQFEYVLRQFRKNGLPLYLRLAFEKAVNWRSYTRTIKLSSDISGIIQDLLNKLSREENHGRIFVSHSLGYLAAAKNGLTEDELLEILFRDERVFQNFIKRSFHEYVKKRLPVIIWSRLYYDIEPYLMVREANKTHVLSFYHRELRDVIKDQYLTEDNEWRFHLQLARYFASQPYHIQLSENERKLAELPYHITFLKPEMFRNEAEEFAILEIGAKCLQIIANKYELQLEEYLDAIKLITTWLGRLGNHRTLVKLADVLLNPLNKQCRWFIMEELLINTLRMAKSKIPPAKIVSYNYGISLALYHMGKYTKSANRAESALKLAKQYNFINLEAELLWHLGAMARFQGKKDLVLNYLKAAEAKAQQLADKGIRAKCLFTYGLIEHGCGNYTKALELYNQVLKIGEDKQIRQAIGERILDLLRIRGDYGFYLNQFELARESWTLLKKYAEELHSPHWLIRAKARLTLINKNIDLSEMKQAWADSLQEELLSGELASAITGYGELAEVCIRRGEMEEALKLCNTAEKLAAQFQTLHAQAGQAYIVGLRLLSQGKNYAAKNQFEESTNLFRKWMSPYQFWVEGTIDRLKAYLPS
ncbi:MAG: DUF4062 domain-containing protein [Candidatus Helarchaeota archaeon]